MIYILTAMYHEAKPIISYLGLKRDNNISKFQVFKNDDVVLIISGLGLIQSAIATTYLLTLYDVKSSDLFINIGICGSKDKKIGKGSVILCHKIIYHDTNKAFYPDIIFKHPFKEGVLETFSMVVGKDKIDSIEGDFVDMEGASVYQAASVFLPPHQINIIKIVSDSLDGERITPKDVNELIEKNIPFIFSWIMERKMSYLPQKDFFTEEEKEYLEKIIKNLRITTAMQYQLEHMAKQYKIRSQNLIDVLTPYLNIECNSKNEGKIYFERLKKELNNI